MQLVAPAGNSAGFYASVNGGADAVYLGMPKFGARAKADNFDAETLPEIIEYAHLLGVKVFVTLNTLIKDGELEKAIDTAKLAYDIGADAAIVQDIRFIEKLKRALPEFTLHASTQMGIHNAEGASVLKNLGIKRAVLSRETLPDDIAEIKSVGIEIEYFVQGALCICFSGNCYFSSLASSYSGNRGKCMQLCRKPYFFHGDRGYYLSAKDLCLYEKLDMLEKLGVDAIKIEGRMRSPEYAYRSADVYKNGKRYDDPVKALKSAFNRGDYCSAYIDGDAPFNVIYPQIQGNIGVSVGKIAAVKNNEVFVPGFVPHRYDGFKIIEKGMELCGGHVSDGKVISDGKCNVGGTLRRTFDGALKEETESAKRTVGIDVNVCIKTGEPMKITMSSGETEISVFGKTAAEKATSCAVKPGDMIRSFEKVADHPFRPEIKTKIDTDAFLPMSEINALRREAYSELKVNILKNYKREKSRLKYVGLDYNRFDGHGTVLMVENGMQLPRSVLNKIDYLALDPLDYNDFDIPETNLPILLNMPVIMRAGDRAILKKAVERSRIAAVISNNLYTLSLTDKPVLLGTGHNIIGKCEYPHITSFESDEYDGGFVYAFGHAPVMTMCHCPYGKCINCSGSDELTDEQGRRFALRRRRIKHCYWQLLNCVPHLVNTDKITNKFYDCTTCGPSDIEHIIDNTYKGAFTRGNLNKGLK